MTDHTEKTVYPEIDKFLKDPRKPLDDFFDCNAFKLQLQEIYKRHQKAGTLSPEKEAEITKYANKLHILQYDLQKEMEKE